MATGERMTLLERVLLFLMLGLSTVFGVVAFRRYQSGREVGSLAPRFVKEPPEWVSLVTAGPMEGRPDAAVRMVAFSDFECPGCAALHATLRTLEQRYPRSFSVTVVHYPLPYHENAMRAANYAECADAAGRFREAQDALFAARDSLARLTPAEFVARLGSSANPELLACAARTDTMPRVLAGRTLAQVWKVRGTPTLIVDGWRFRDVPTLAELDSVLAEALRRNRPRGPSSPAP